ncbi:hypothetical protein N431DRAFT_483625 [Stipitochalara longipes BDJ]|nr:hypothetical protein N431DRAFT_483625 [Stipitochalara longipes BDJ]
MPTYVVQVETGLSEEKFAEARSALEKQGGTINDEQTAWKREGKTPGFEVSFPDDSVKTLESIPYFFSAEEAGGDYKTQKTQ